jgi:hypothetical protein
MKFRFGRRHQLRLEHSRYGCRNFVLNGEDVVQLAIITFRPQVESVGGIDQLDRHTNTAPGFPYATFQNMLHAQLSRDLRDLDILSFERECGRSRCNVDSG